MEKEKQQSVLARKGRLVTAVFFILSGILAATWASRIPDIQEKLGLGNAAWGTVLFASPAGLVCGLMVASRLTAEFGTKKILITSSILSCFFLVLSGFSNERYQLMAVLFLMGFMRTILNISANTLSLEVQSMYRKSIISTFHGLWSLACFIAASIGTLMIIYNVLPRFHFLIIAIICLLTSLIFSKTSVGNKVVSIEKKPFFVRPDRFLFHLGVVAFCAMICENAMFDWSVNYFEKVVQAGKGLVTAGYTSFIISMTLGRLLGDRIIGYFGHMKVLFYSGLLISFGFIIAAVFPTPLTAIAGFIIIGLGDSIIVPIVYALSGRTGKMPAGYAISAVTLIGYAGFLTGPLLIGFVSGALNLQWAFGIISIFGIFITLLSLKIKSFEELRN